MDDPLPARGFTTGGPLPEAWKEALAKTTEDADWQPTPVHVEDFLDWHAQAEDRDEWTDPRIITPLGVGQEGDRVSLNQKWWILLFLEQEKAYRVRPTYRPPRRPRSRSGSPYGSGWEEMRARWRTSQQSGSQAEPPLSPPPLGSGAGEERPNPWGEIA